MKNSLKKTVFITILAVISILNISRGQSTTTNLNTEFRIICTAINGDNLYVGTENGVYLSTDGGEKWIPINNGLPKKSRIYKLVAIGNNIFASTSEYSSFVSSNNGIDWIAINIGSGKITIHDIVIFKNKLFSSTNKGLFTSADNGLNWTTIPEMVNGDISVVIGENYILSSEYIDAYQSNYFSSSDGIKWQAIKGLDGLSIEKLGADGNIIYANKCKWVVNNGSCSTCRAYLMWILSENGKKWNPISIYTRYFGFYRNNIYAITAQVEEHKKNDYRYIMKVMVSEDRGNKWTIINEETDPFVLSDISIQNKLKELRDGAAGEVDYAKKSDAGIEEMKKAAKEEKERRGKYQYGDPFYIPLQTTLPSNSNAQKSNDRFQEMNNHRDSYIDSNGNIHIK